MKRRKFVSSVGASIMTSTSGCLEIINKNSKSNNKSNKNISNKETSLIPTGEDKLLEYKRSKLLKKQRSGNVGKDGIPSIDNPTIVNADKYESDIFSDNIIFGININGKQRAYPRNILTKHEIVNDSINNKNISVTYCPLTGTAIGFYRGETTFGVSGKLINNNLVMYDRETDSRWPQMLGSAISGPKKGSFLKEFRVIWTTWDKWVEKYPNTTVLSTDTGYLKNYSSGSYGTYQPRTGYYELSSNPLFPSLKQSNEYPNKSVFIGGRSDSESYGVKKDYIRKNKIVKLKDNISMIYNNKLDTGHIYKINSSNIKWSDGKIKYNNDKYLPSNIPVSRVNSYDAMWFAWNGYYPNSIIKP